MANRFISKKADKSTDDDDLLQKQLSVLGDISEEPENMEPIIAKAQVTYSPLQQDTLQGEQSIIQKGVIIDGSIKSETALSIFGTVNGNIVCEHDVTINGNITGDIKATNLQLISGKINGNISCKNTATIHKSSNVKGNVEGVTLNCDGRIDGNINLTGNATLKENSIVIGDIASKKISVTEGAVCRGIIQIDFADPQSNEENSDAVLSAVRESIASSKESSFDKLSKDISLHKYI